MNGSLSMSGAFKSLAILAGLIAAIVGPLALELRTELAAPQQDAVNSGNDILALRKVVAVAAHPDDLEWYMGGTLRRLSDAGARVRVVVASSGEKGPNRTGAPDLARAREAEQLDAARVNRYAEVTFLRLPDRGVAVGPKLLAALKEVLERERPEAVFAFDAELPALPYVHPDHVGSGRIAARAARLVSPAPTLYLVSTRRPSVASDITPVIESKLRALQMHRTQNAGHAPSMKGFMARSGKLVGLPFAELYRKVSLPNTQP